MRLYPLRSQAVWYQALPMEWLFLALSPVRSPMSRLTISTPIRQQLTERRNSSQPFRQQCNAIMRWMGLSGPISRLEFHNASKREKAICLGSARSLVAENHHGANNAGHDCVYVWLYCVDGRVIVHQESDASAVGLCRFHSIRKIICQSTLGCGDVEFGGVWRFIYRDFTTDWFSAGNFSRSEDSGGRSHSYDLSISHGCLVCCDGDCMEVDLKSRAWHRKNGA